MFIIIALCNSDTHQVLILHVRTMTPDTFTAIYKITFNLNRTKSDRWNHEMKIFTLHNNQKEIENMKITAGES